VIATHTCQAVAVVVAVTAIGRVIDVVLPRVDLDLQLPTALVESYRQAVLGHLLFVEPAVRYLLADQDRQLLADDALGLHATDTVPGEETDLIHVVAMKTHASTGTDLPLLPRKRAHDRPGGGDRDHQVPSTSAVTTQDNLLFGRLPQKMKRAGVRGVKGLLILQMMTPMVQKLTLTSASARALGAPLVQDRQVGRVMQSVSTPALQAPLTEPISPSKLTIGPPIFCQTTLHFFSQSIPELLGVKTWSTPNGCGNLLPGVAASEHANILRSVGTVPNSNTKCIDLQFLTWPWNAWKVRSHLQWVTRSHAALCVFHGLSCTGLAFGDRWASILPSIRMAALDTYSNLQPFRRLHWAATTLISSGLPVTRSALLSPSMLGSVDYTSFNGQALINGLLHVWALSKWILCYLACCIYKFLRNVAHAVGIALLGWFFACF
jgi:hypothetical protein